MINETYQSVLAVPPSGEFLAAQLLNRTFDLQVGQMRMTPHSHGIYHVRVCYFNSEKEVFQV